MISNAITSRHNQRVKDAVKLRDRRQRIVQGRFFIDGAREILRALEAGLRLSEVFICQPLCTTFESRQVAERLNTANTLVWDVTPEVFEKLSFGQRRDGVLAVADTPDPTSGDLNVPRGSLVAVLAGLEKPGNVGAALRSADAAGVAAVIVTGGGTDLYNPNCIRASLGTVFSLKTCESSTEATLAWLRSRGTKIFAARLDATRSYTAADYRGEVALVLGSEASGLDAPWQAPDILPIKIPLSGAADSLNVSAAAAVLFYEAVRQRQV